MWVGKVIIIEGQPFDLVQFGDLEITSSCYFCFLEILWLMWHGGHQDGTAGGISSSRLI